MYVYFLTAGVHQTHTHTHTHTHTQDTEPRSLLPPGGRVRHSQKEAESQAVHGGSRSPSLRPIRTPRCRVLGSKAVETGAHWLASESVVRHYRSWAGLDLVLV